MKSSDRQLIRNIRKGDAKSFEELFDRYYDRFYAFACALLHDRDAAEDILQNVFLKLWIGRVPCPTISLSVSAMKSMTG